MMQADLKNWQGKTVVVKYGGNAMLDASLKQAVAQDPHAGSFITQEFSLQITKNM